MQEDYSEFLKLDPETFDQDEEKGWRKVSDPSEAAKIIKAYLKEHQNDLRAGSIDDRELEGLMHFHVGQSLMFVSDNNVDEALKEFAQSDFDGQERWNTYVAATIAFLKQDLSALEVFYTRVKRLEDDEGSHKNLSKTTKKLLDSLSSGQTSYADAFR